MAAASQQALKRLATTHFCRVSLEYNALLAACPFHTAKESQSGIWVERGSYPKARSLPQGQSRPELWRAVYFTVDTTLGYDLRIVETRAEAMASAMRIAERNAWNLLRVDNQTTLVDIFRVTWMNSPLADNVDRYGPIRAL